MDLNTAIKFLSKEFDMMITCDPEGDFIMDGDSYTKEEIIESAEEQLKIISEYEGVRPGTYLAGFLGKRFFGYSMACLMFEENNIPFEEHDRDPLKEGDVDSVVVFGKVYAKQEFLRLVEAVMRGIGSREGKTFSDYVSYYWSRRA